MLPILIAVALVAFAPLQEEEEGEPGIVSAAPVVYGGAGYQAAFDRAQRYEADGRLGAYREQTFAPAMNRQLEDIYHACVIPVAGQLPPSTGRATSPLVSLLEVTLATTGVPRQAGRVCIWPAIAT